MKRILLIFGLLFIFTGVVSADVPKLAPLNPDYVKYLDKIEQDKKSGLKSIGKALGYIPPPNKFHTEVSGSFQSKAPLPSSFDLRAYNHVSPVQDQGSGNTCWAFSTTASLESNWMKTGLGAFDLSENSIKECHGFLWGGDSGGNSSISAAYLSRMNGPKLEAEDPYNARDGSCSTAGEPAMYVTDYRILPDDANAVKQAIYNNGAVYSSMQWEDSAYRESDNTYYHYNANAIDNIPDHAVTIVGWDDNRETAGGMGAWIIKNSWGAGWGDNGYFYISYNDTVILNESAFWPNSISYNPEAELYMYDNLGALGGFGQEDNLDYGLIKFTADFDLNIEKIGLWINHGSTEVDIEIFDNFTGGILSSPLQTLSGKICTYAGYYTFDLNASINISMGDDFYIKVKYHAPPGSTLVIPVEGAVENYSNPVIESGKCWVSDTGNSNSWDSIGYDTDYKFDLCIRAYTTPPPNGRPVVNTTSAARVLENSAECRGDITSLGTSDIIQHGVCWSRLANPKITDKKTSEGSVNSTGPFITEISGLSAGTTYYFKAYATGNSGTSYGAEMTFKTSPYTPVKLNNDDDGQSGGCFIGNIVNE